MFYTGHNASSWIQCDSCHHITHFHSPRIMPAKLKWFFIWKLHFLTAHTWQLECVHDCCVTMKAVTLEFNSPQFNGRQHVTLSHKLSVNALSCSLPLAVDTPDGFLTQPKVLVAVLYWIFKYRLQCKFQITYSFQIHMKIKYYIQIIKNI